MTTNNATIKIPGFIHADKNWDGGYSYHHFNSEDMSSIGYMLVCENNIEFQLPVGWNAAAAEVAALRKAKDKLQDDYMRKSKELTQKIDDLLCLEAPLVVEAAIAADPFDDVPF
jgi:hypothetical protein